MPNNPESITLLLGKWSGGDQEAFDQLVSLAYDDLRAIAHRRLAFGGDGDLATTALVHEVYLKLVGHGGGEWESRGHFFAFASTAMRHILVDHARKSSAKRRGGGIQPMPLDHEIVSADRAVAEVLGVDEALEQLAVRHPRMAKVVELRFFGGLSVTEAAEVLSVSVRTVEREWTRAKAYLLEVLSEDEPE